MYHLNNLATTSVVVCGIIMQERCGVLAAAVVWDDSLLLAVKGYIVARWIGCSCIYPVAQRVNAPQQGRPQTQFHGLQAHRLISCISKDPLRSPSVE